MTPVILMSDGYIANSSEPWRLPDVDAQVEFEAVRQPETRRFMPYSRDPRPWPARGLCRDGRAGAPHRGLEHADLTGNISYDPRRTTN